MLSVNKHKLHASCEKQTGTLIAFVWADVNVVICLNDRRSYFSGKSSIFWSWTAKEAISMKDVHIYANRGIAERACVDFLSV